MMAHLTTLQIGIVAVAFLSVYVLASVFTRKRRAYPLPPGPKPLPLLGNVADLPPTGAPEFKHWIKHKDLYGPISSVTVMGQTIILIHDAQLALDMMEKRSSIYSGRPLFYFAAKMCGWDKGVVFQANNDLFRAYRKDMHSSIGTKTSVAHYSQLQETEVQRFLLGVFRTPEKTIEHAKASSGAIILQIVYGYSIDQNNIDPLVSLVEDAIVEFADAATPGKWAVDVFLALRHLPDWMPGTAFKKVAKQYRRITSEAVERPYAFAKRQIGKGDSSRSLASDLLGKEEQAMKPETESRIKWSLGALYVGGQETQVATLQWFFIAMLLYPHTQKTAQDEIDRIIGKDRLPSLADRDNLPYTNALFKEVLRWNAIATMGVPHASTKDDDIVVLTEEGEKHYTIPGGSIILPNIWCFLRDPSRYRDPDIFNPERFMGEKAETDPATMVFGFGRRICPGRVLADTSVWLLIAQTLAAFEIRVKRDEMGREMNVHAEGIPGLVYYPMPFEEKMDIGVRESRRSLLEKLEKTETLGVKEGMHGQKDSEILKGLEVKLEDD